MEIALCIAVVILIIAVVLFFVLKSRRSDGKDKGKTGEKATSSGIDKSKVQALKSGGSVTDKLLTLDVGSDIVQSIQEQLASDKNAKFDDILVNMLPEDTTNDIQGLHTIIFVGVNGVGKTTTLGKIAKLKSSAGDTVVLAAADTFRAAAADQLEIWSKRANTKGEIKLIRGKEGADPASVAYEATQTALESGAKWLFIDTAGRQQSNKDLMDELAKIKRVVEKNTPVQDIYLVLDGTAGQTTVKQAKEFSNVTDVTGIVLTKLDGSAKGGAIFAVTRELNVPVKYIGFGEGVDDIKAFNAREFVEAL